MMRRRLEYLVPIVLLAVLVQLLAPIAAFRSVALAASDPLYMASLCSEMAASADHGSVPDPAQHSGKCCAFCAGGIGGSNPLQPPSFIFVSLQRQYQLVAWLEAETALPTVRVGSNAQARAPPVHS